MRPMFTFQEWQSPVAVKCIYPSSNRYCMPGVLWFPMTNGRVPGVLVAYCLHLDISHFDKANDLIV